MVMTHRNLIAILVLFAMTSQIRADDAKDKSKARARAALALATVESPTTVASDPPVMAARAAAKAALNKCGPACPCEPCDCEPGACECCKGEKTKAMPTAKEKPARTVEKWTYSQLAKAVAALKPGESVKVYAGQDAPASATGSLIVLADAIPGEEQIVGVWKCWRVANQMQYATAQPPKGCKRVVIDGRYYDQDADGSLYWCVACNRGR